MTHHHNRSNLLPFVAALVFGLTLVAVIFA